jgi:hypothetical protein
MKHFTIQELIRTSTKLPNSPNREQQLNLEHLVVTVLDPAREWFNAPVEINSGFRSDTVNDSVGGARGSQHLSGEAADITCKNNGTLFTWIMRNTNFDQLIWEHGDIKNPAWIHVSAKRNGKNRGEALMSFKVKAKTVYRKLN